MDLMTVIGLIVSWTLVLAAMIGGGNGLAYVDFPSVLITIGGTTGALIATCPSERLKTTIGIFKSAFVTSSKDMVVLVQTIVSFAEKARREGLLSLEGSAAELTDNEFLRKSIQLVVDGTDPELVRAILDTEIGILESRHVANKSLFDSGSELAPAFGMIGTLIGLIAMLGNLTDVEALGPGMAVALITTMYGSMMANMIFIPISKKLAVRSSEEVLSLELMVEGVLAIQAGENPRIVEEKLKVYLPPKQRLQLEQAKSSGGQ
ncbi:MAG: MotA/TolQ/ExbB proton channel family protein [Synergistaceae bacterium]|nr:MotA/TolQ/ExbB proton channel family protein [Synergistaceae bacterium]